MGSKLIVRFSPDDIFSATAIFKNHREFIQHLFKKQFKATITKWNWDMQLDRGHWDKQEDGCEFKRTDSELAPMFEVHAEIDKNARYLTEEELG